MKLSQLRTLLLRSSAFLFIMLQLCAFYSYFYHARFRYFLTTARAEACAESSLIHKDAWEHILHDSTNDVIGVVKNSEKIKLISTDRTLRDVRCSQLFQDDQQEMRHAHDIMNSRRKKLIMSTDYENFTNDCDNFKRMRGYITETMTKEEEEFPLAFSLLMFKDIEQVERLLRAIYRPEHVYCIHVDKKAEPDVHSAMAAISECFQNVFLLREHIVVKWATFSVLKPELLCMKELWNYKKWKYFINLTGQMFPIKTNLQLIRILKAVNGSNLVEGKREGYNRWDWLNPPPHGIKPFKGYVNVAIKRAYVEFVLFNKIALDFLEWVKFTDIPDETFFSTLNYNPHLGIPGAYTGKELTKANTLSYFVRFTNWGTWPCEGKIVRDICVFGVGDLPLLYDRYEMFVNKFFLDFQYLALDCLEELHFNRTRDEYLEKYIFNITYYKQFDFVKNRL